MYFRNSAPMETGGGWIWKGNDDNIYVDFVIHEKFASEY